MAFCQTCGNENRSGARFCRNCGQPLEELSANDTTSVVEDEATATLPEIPYAEETVVFEAMEEPKAVLELAAGQAEPESLDSASVELGEAAAAQVREPPEGQTIAPDLGTAGPSLVEDQTPPAGSLDQVDENPDQDGDFDQT